MLGSHVFILHAAQTGMGHIEAWEGFHWETPTVYTLGPCNVLVSVGLSDTILLSISVQVPFKLPG